MAHLHYVIDFYFAANGDTLRREVLRIAASGDAEAIDEANRINGWRCAVRYDVRAIKKSARAGHRLVHSSDRDAIVNSEEQRRASRPAAGTAESFDTSSSPQDGVTV